MDRIAPVARLRAAALLAAGLLVAGAGRAGTLDLLPGSPGYVHERFGLQDGLPRAGIARVIQTRDGFLWLATFDGLVRFDGARFEVFDSARAPALGSNRIEDLVEARDGALWIRTEQGHLARFSNGALTACGPSREDRVACTQREPGGADFLFLLPDSAGALWAAGIRSGLWRVSGDRLEKVPGLPSGSAFLYVLRDRSGLLWVASSREVWRGLPGRFAPVPLPEPIDEATLAEDAGGEVWIATPKGAGRFRNGRFTFEIPGRSFVGRDGRGGVWISLADRVLRYRAGRFETALAGMPGRVPVPDRQIRRGPGNEVWIAQERSLYRNGAVAPLPGLSGGISSLHLDREGTLWAGSWQSGELHALHPARVTTLEEGLPNPTVYPLYEDRDGTVWAGGGGFLASLAPGSRRFRGAAGPAGPWHHVTAFRRDGAGTFWVGTERGLYVRERDGFVPAGGEALRTAVVRAILEDSRGTLWVGTDDGLFRREPAGRGGRWSRLPRQGGLPLRRIRVLRETPDGALWIGSNGGGVVRLDRGRLTAVTRAHGLSSDLVRTIELAPDGRLWIGTENGGLSRLDPASVDEPGGPRIAVIGERQGLYTNGIHQIVADGLGSFWMSSNHGIFSARLADLNAVADGRRERLETVAFTERDGMADREANGSSGFRDRSGRIWFPTVRGVVRLDPREALRRSPPPRASIVRLRTGEEEIPLEGGAVRLSPTQRSFAVELSAPSFRAPERQRFRVRLRPYDRDWVDLGNRREVFYTKVPPGPYLFEALASGPAGEWSGQPAALRLEVVPRFFETGWFRALCALGSVAALVGLVVGTVRLREARQTARRRELENLVEQRTATIAEQADRLRELDRLKSQLFANISHELRTPLTLTLGPLRDALDGRFGPLRDDLAGQLGVAERNANRLLGLVDQLLDSARLDAGRLRLRVRRSDLAAFVRERVEAFLPLAGRRDVELSLEAPSEPVDVWFDEAQLEKVFENLLGNALKFTPRGGDVQVTVAAPAEAGRVAVSVRDSGPGIPAGQLERIFERFYQVEETAGRRWPGAGIGLSLARELVELHGGSIAVESLEGRGACFTVSLLRGNAHFPPELLDEGRREEVRPSGVMPVVDLEEPGDGDGDGGPDSGAGDDRTTVLVVDDNPEIRAYVRRHLEPGYRVVEAADGVEGLERARRLVPDVVVSDVMMPGLDGNALFRALREDPELELVPVILLTAKASSESRLQGLREGVDDYLVKPFDPRELRARVDNLVASRRRLWDKLKAMPPRPLRATEVQVTPADEAFLARVQAAIEERLGDTGLSVEGLAEDLGCDRSYLLRKLRALTGETPSGLIRSFRLQRAEQLLRAGAGAVSEIAYTVGFKSVAHFSNAFQERYGERPSAFAARHRNR